MRNRPGQGGGRGGRGRLDAKPGCRVGRRATRPAGRFWDGRSRRSPLVSCRHQSPLEGDHWIRRGLVLADRGVRLAAAAPLAFHSRLCPGLLSSRAVAPRLPPRLRLSFACLLSLFDSLIAVGSLSRALAANTPQESIYQPSLCTWYKVSPPRGGDEPTERRYLSRSQKISPRSPRYLGEISVGFLFHRETEMNPQSGARRETGDLQSAPATLQKPLPLPQAPSRF